MRPTKTISRVLCVLALCVPTLTACGGAAEEGETDESATTTGGEADGPAMSELAWADVPPEQRGQWMAEVVVPAMQPLFQETDPERFADFGCATCHGATGQDVHFEMPNGIAPLNPADVGAMFQSEQPMAQLMVQQVWPRMTELLGEQPHNRETNEGFGCFSCHGTADGS